MSFFTRLRDLATAPVRAMVDPLGQVAGQARIVAAENPEIKAILGQQSQDPAQVQAPSGGSMISEEQRQQILAPLPAVTLERLGGAEEQAQRSQLARELMAQQQAGQRQLLAQQAKQGVRGGAATAQQSRLAQQIAAQRAAQEEQGFLQRRMFNIEQAQREQFAGTASELARRQLAASLLGQEMQARAAERFGQQQIAAAQAGAKDKDGLLGLGILGL